MMVQQVNDRHLCWERVLRANKLFRISHLFAPEEYAERLLALHALFASIDQLSSEVSEELVARKKLEWWRFELSARQMKHSRHPVVRYLRETGASASLPASALESLLDTAERRIDAIAPLDINEFNHLCLMIYQPKTHLEGALSGLGSELFADRKELVGEGGLLQLMRESFTHSRHGFWWVPLNTLARFGVTRQDLRDKGDAPEVRAVFHHILEKGREPPVPEERRDQVMADSAPGLLHMQLTALLQKRQLHHMKKRDPSRFGTELNRWHFSDLLAAWKLARQIRKKGG
jgi:phytoene synthase